MWDTFFIQPLANSLFFFYHIFGNLGVAIIALTVAVRLILVPLTLPSMRQMQKMRDLAPELAKIKERHKNDKMKLAQAQADFYKSRGINPAAGCLPQIVQMVFLIALFGTLSKVVNSNGDVAGHINNLLYEQLRLTNGVETHFLGYDILQKDVINIPGLPVPLPGAFLLLSAAVQFLSSKMMAPAAVVSGKKAAKTSGGMDDAMAAMQKQMLYMFPLMTVFIGYSFPLGLVLYWFVFSLFQAVQQYFISGWGGLAPWVKRLGLVQLSR